MPDLSPAPQMPINVAVHAPYEDMVIEGLRFGSKCIDSLTELVRDMTPEQRKQVIDNWLKFWQPLINLITIKPIGGNT